MALLPAETPFFPHFLPYSFPTQFYRHQVKEQSARHQGAKASYFLSEAERLLVLVMVIVATLTGPRIGWVLGVLAVAVRGLSWLSS